MHLTRLTLSHFRSHRQSEIDIDRRPVAIFGPNGSGKTNLLEAVSMLSPGRGLRRASSEDMMRQPEALGWRIAAETAGGAAHEIDTRSTEGQGRSVRIDGKAVPQTALGRTLRMLWLVPAMDRLWIEGAEGRRRFLDRMCLSFDPDHAEASLIYERAMRERNRLLRDQVGDAHWYTALEARMVEAGTRIVDARSRTLARLAQAQEMTRTAFPVSDLSIAGPDDGGAFDADALAAGRRRDMAAGRTLSGPHRADLVAVYRDKGVAAAQSSTGEQKALLISLVLANARALKAELGSAPVLLLDEVAAHLDAGRRAALYDEIEALDAQAWMTGTGAEFFAVLGARAQCFEIAETAGSSRILR